MSESLSPLERSVLGQLDEEALVESLVELVRIPSMGGSDAEVEVQEHVAATLRDLDAEVDRWDIDLDELAGDPWFPGVEVERTQAVGVVGTTAGDGAPGLVLCGHLDVVPAGDVETWGGSDPFSAEIRDNALYGRGSCDMKAGMAANLAVVRTLRDAGVRLERPLALHAVVGEEDGGLGAFATLRRGHRGDACVITEPTSAQMITATAGALTFRIEVIGRSAHGLAAARGRQRLRGVPADPPGADGARGRTQQGHRPRVRQRPAVRTVLRGRAVGRVVVATSPTSSSPRDGSAYRSTRTRAARAPCSRTSSQRQRHGTGGCRRTDRWSPGRAVSSPAAGWTTTIH